MPRLPKREQEEPFYDRLAEFMVRHQKDAWQASIELELGLRKEDAENLYKQTAFQRVLRAARIRLANEVGDDPNIQKNTMLGLMYHCIDNLIQTNQFDKAGNQIVNYAKIAGMTTADSTVNIFAGLSGKELAEMKKKIQQEHEGETRGLLN